MHYRRQPCCGELFRPVRIIR